MRKIIQILIFGIFVSACSSTKVGKQTIKYFDQNNIEINKSEFD